MNARTSRKIILTAGLLTILLASLATPVLCASRLYWTEWKSYSSSLSRIARANADGTGGETLMDGLTDGVGPRDLAVDSINGKLYWSNKSAAALHRCNLDGTGDEAIVNEAYPEGLALDVAGGKIYWADYTYSEPRIRRANLDGTDVEDLAACTAGCVLVGLALDLPAGKVYWTERMDQEIKRANMAGGGVETVLHCYDGIGHPWGIAVTGNRIYWADGEAILSADKDGDNMQTVVDLVGDDIRQIELDADAGKLYWVTGDMFGGSMVQCANLDGTGLQTLITGLYYGYGLALEFGDASAAPLPMAAELDLRNYPNPFNPSTTIAFQLPESGRVTVDLFDSRGRLVKNLAEGMFSEGQQRLSWDGTDQGGRPVGSGVYLCRVKTRQGVAQQRRLTLLK